MSAIKENVLKELNKPSVRLRIAMVNNNTTEHTVSRWIRTNHKNLTLPQSLKVIEEATGLTQEEILTD